MDGMNGVERPEIAVVAPGERLKTLSARLRESGGEPLALELPEPPEDFGPTLLREWLADYLEVSLSGRGPKALLFDGDSAAELSGAITCAIRLDLPAVCAMPPVTSFAAAVAAIGLSPLGDGEDSEDEEPARTAVRLAEEGGEAAGDLADEFALANALRVGISLGAGPELLIHLAALGKESGVIGFARMARVLVPETPVLCAVGSEWFKENGVRGVLHHLLEDLHDTRTISGVLKDHARETGEEPPRDAEFGYSFIKARTSGAEALCLVPKGTEEFSGECRVFDGEEEAVEALSAEYGEGEDDVILLVRGCGPRGAPGMRVLGELDEVLKGRTGGGEVVVLTDGLAPEGASGVWVSAFVPEASSGGIISRLADDDALKLDFEEGRILTSVERKEISSRSQQRPIPPQSPAYAARYARSALSAFDGAGFT